MHSSASRAMDGTSSVRCAGEDSNLRFISEARKEPKASAVSSGTVIIDRSRLAVLVRPLRDVTKLENPRHVQPYSRGPADGCDVCHRLEKICPNLEGVGCTPRKFATADRLSEPAGSNHPRCLFATLARAGCRTRTRVRKTETASVGWSRTKSSTGPRCIASMARTSQSGSDMQFRRAASG